MSALILVDVQTVIRFYPPPPPYTDIFNPAGIDTFY